MSELKKQVQGETMKPFRRITGLAVVVLMTVMAPFPSGSRAASQKEGPVVVGRVSHIEGELLSYVYEEKDWVPILKDVPFGLEDTLYSDQDARAEIIFPNGTWIRIGGNTQIQAIALDDDVTEIDVASGIARFYNRGSQSVIQATTPFGYVLAPAGTMFDLYVGDESAEVIALKGTVDFVHARNESRYEVQSGSSSLVVDDRAMASGQGLVDAGFDDWNGQRDSLWAKRLEVKGDSTRYLPSQLHDDAYELEENGRWDRVQYEGEYRQLWRPTRVGPEWAPYTNGRWTTYYGDQCWVPAEPFGYTTHHYGSWVFIDSCRCWYWAPPVATPVVAARPWTVGYGWYPGRVSWIYGADNVGWAPLAPYEPYYATRYWGPSSVAVASLGLATAVVNLATLHNLDHAYFVGRRDFWGVDNYHRHGVRNINRTTIINNYYGSHVVDRRVIRDFDSRRDRFNFVNREVRFKPHRTVVERIDRNQRLAARQERIEARTLLKDTRNVRQGSLDRSVKVERPRVTNRLVSADNVNKPASEVKFQQRELKKQERQQRAVEQRVLRQQGQQDRLQQREDRQQQQKDDGLQRREQRQQELQERREGRERVRPEKPSREVLDQRRQEREEKQQQKQQQLDERRQQREEKQQTRPERPDAGQRQQMKEDRQQQQLDERRQQREEKQQTRPERPDAGQRQQMKEDRQQQQLEERQQRQQQEREQQQQLQRQQQQKEGQRQQQQERQQQQQLQRQQQQQERQQQQQMQRQQEIQQRQQQQLQKRQQQQERQQQQQPRDKRRQKIEEEQQPPVTQPQ